ncbi:hypothetical protein DITRI_Ditri05aG0028600 [Diplodiscus trichospermus]
MSSALEMSLDDLIKRNRKSGSGNTRGRGRGSGPGPTRRFGNRGANRSAPYTTAKAPETTWHNDMYSDKGVAFQGQAGRASAIETGTKLYISNLDYGVSNDDIKELFSEVGDLKRYAIHYDRSGRSKVSNHAWHKPVLPMKFFEFFSSLEQKSLFLREQQKLFSHGELMLWLR